MDRPIGDWSGEPGRRTRTSETRAWAPDQGVWSGKPLAEPTPDGGDASGQRSYPNRSVVPDRASHDRPSSPETKRITTGRDALSVSLFVRGSADARSREESVSERLRELQREGQIGELTVRTWPGEVSLSREGNSEIVDTFRTFEEWAQAHDASIRPPFTVRDRHSTITDQADRLLLTPLVCLALYDVDGIVGVYPCIHGESVTTIDDCLERLTRDDARAVTPPGRGARDRRDRSTKCSTDHN